MPDSKRVPWRRILGTLVVCVLIAAAAIGVIFVIEGTEPTATKEGATRRTAALVETVAARRGTFRPQLRVLGVVRPARDVQLSPQVSGQIAHREPAFVPGRRVQAGDPLLQIDAADFEQLVISRTSVLRQAEADLALEEGQQYLARQEFAALGEDLDAANRALVLREPQIASVRARIDAARAAVAQARLDLERTTLTAPFDAQILTTNVDVGSRVAPGDALGRLVGIDECWVIATVRLEDLRWLEFADVNTGNVNNGNVGDRSSDDGSVREPPGSPVRVRHARAWPEGVYRSGTTSRLIGAVDAETRLARVVVTVPDPLATGVEAPPLVIGTLVDVEFEGRAIEDVVRIDRDHLRQRDTLWVMVENALEIRSADVTYRDAKYAYIRDGLEDDDLLVTSSLATVTEGLPLRRVEPPGDPESQGSGDRDHDGSEATP